MVKMSLKYKAVIFDVDGVIVDYESLLVDMTIEDLALFGVKISREEYLRKYYRAFAGNTGKGILEIINKDFKTNIEYQEYFDSRRNLRPKYFHKMKLEPHIEDLLEFFYRNKLKIGLATSSDTFKLDYINQQWPSVFKYFNVKYTSEDVVNGKPNPEIFLKTAKALSVSPKDTLVLEDSINGLIAAKAGGFDCIILKNPFIREEEYLPYKPRGIVKDLREIIKLFQSAESSL